MNETMDKRIAYLEFVNRENSFHHHRYDDDMRQFEMLKNGDMNAVDESRRMMYSDEIGLLSDDPVKNMRSLNICHATLCTRFAIEGGMDPEKAYNASDIFIRRCDAADTLDEQYDLHMEMIEYFTKQVISAKKANVYSKQVIHCMEYIGSHLHEEILVSRLADMVKLNASYLSVLFKEQTGMNISEYITVKRMETAENMLKFSDFTLSEISDILHYSSYSHFARTFRRYCDTSPKKYRDTHYRRTVMTE